MKWRKNPKSSIFSWVEHMNGPLFAWTTFERNLKRTLWPGGQVALAKMLPPLASHKRKYLPFFLAKSKQPLLHSHSLLRLGYLLLPGVGQQGQHQLLLHNIHLKSRLDNSCWSMSSSSPGGMTLSKGHLRYCRWVSEDRKQSSHLPEVQRRLWERE